MPRRWSLLALTLLAFLSAYYFYYYDATSVLFTGPAGTLMLMASVFATGFLLSGGHGHHGHDGHGHHEHPHHEAGHHHAVDAHGHPTTAQPPQTTLPEAPKPR